MLLPLVNMKLQLIIAIAQTFIFVALRLVANFLLYLNKCFGGTHL